jgi:cyanophycinase
MLNHPFTLLHARDRAEADREEFVAPLKAATAVWYSGGRQWRLVDAYAGTRTEREIRAVLDRGGLIAGTSAGATIQGSYLVRGSPESNLVMMSPGHEQGFGYVSNAAVDQHANVRERECDLADVVAAHPEVLGIGIDEGTAIVVRRNLMTVIGIGRVLITDGVAHVGLPYYPLVAGDRFDLGRWTRLPPHG